MLATAIHWSARLLVEKVIVVALIRIETPLPEGKRVYKQSVGSPIGTTSSHG
jgi:hypothetical protein